MTVLVSAILSGAWGALCASQDILVTNSFAHAAIVCIPALLIGVAVPFVGMVFFR